MIWFMRKSTIKQATDEMSSLISQLIIIDLLIHRHRSAFHYEQSIAEHAKERIPEMNEDEYVRYHGRGLDKARSKFIESLDRYSETLRMAQKLLEDPIYKSAYMRIKLQGGDDFPHS